MGDILPLISSIASLFLFWGIELIVQSRQSKASYVCKLLGIITLVWFLALTKDILSVLGQVNSTLSRYLLSWDLLTIPLTSIYVFEIVRPGWSRPKKYFRILLPILGGIGIYSFLYFNKSNYANLAFDLLCLYAIAYIAYMVAFVYKNKKRYRFLIENNFSFDDRINIRWIDIVQYLFFWDCICYFITVAYDLAWTNTVYYCSIGITWWILYHFTCLQDTQSLEKTDMVTEDISPDAMARSGNPDDSLNATLAEIGKRIEKKMLEEQYFLNPNLTLAELAASIGSNKTYVYLYLKHSKKTSFSDYVNNLRIKEKSIPLLKSNISAPGLTINEIAFLSGFQSISTFRRAFSKSQGCTASSYITKLKTSQEPSSQQ